MYSTCELTLLYRKNTNYPIFLVLGKMKVSTLERGIDPLSTKSKSADLIIGLSLRLRDGWSQKVSSLLYIMYVVGKASAGSQGL